MITNKTNNALKGQKLPNPTASPWEMIKQKPTQALPKGGMLNSLCPEGVPMVKIGSKAKVLRGKRLTKPELSNGGDYPVYHGGIEPIGYYTISNRPKDTVMVINVGASAGTVGFCDREFWSSDGCFCIEKSDDINSKYLYHYLKNYEYIFMKKVRHAGIPTLDARVISDFEIPLPPLSIQQEIVKILDSFTAYAAELQAELQARKQQYEYYRNQLFTHFEGDQPVKEYSLGELADLKAGKAIKATELSEKDELHLYPCFGGNGIRGYIAKYSHNGDYPIIGRQGALCGCVNWASGDFYATEHAVVVAPKSNNNPRYLYYMLEVANLNQYKSQGAQPGLAVSNLNELKFQVPSLAEQSRIVSILDKFEALVNDLSAGLPAEIAAVQEQYEYYRNKLLTF